MLQGVILVFFTKIIEEKKKSLSHLNAFSAFKMSFPHPAFVWLLLLCLCPSTSLTGGKRTDTKEDNTKRKPFSAPFHLIHFQLQVPSCWVIFGLRWISIASLLHTSVTAAAAGPSPVL